MAQLYPVGCLGRNNLCLLAAGPSVLAPGPGALPLISIRAQSFLTFSDSALMASVGRGELHQEPEREREEPKTKARGRHARRSGRLQVKPASSLSLKTQLDTAHPCPTGQLAWEGLLGGSCAPCCPVGSTWSPELHPYPVPAWRGCCSAPRTHPAKSSTDGPGRAAAALAQLVACDRTGSSPR